MLTSIDHAPIPQVTVVLADDETLILQGLATMLEDLIPGLLVVAIVGSFAEAKAAIAHWRPDLLITDLIVGGNSMLSAIDEVTQDSPETRILILSSSQNPAIARTFKSYGAHGFLSKNNCTTEELADAVRTVLRGELFSERRSDSNNNPEEASCLSHRERKVLSLIAVGLTNVQIAKRLYLSLRTVEAHRAAIRSKLGISTRAELTAFARAVGLSV